MTEEGDGRITIVGTVMRLGFFKLMATCAAGRYSDVVGLSSRMRVMILADSVHGRFPVGWLYDELVMPV